MMHNWNDDDYHRALARADELEHAKPGTPEYEEHARLTRQIEEYEDEL